MAVAFRHRFAVLPALFALAMAAAVAAALPARGQDAGDPPPPPPGPPETAILWEELPSGDLTAFPGIVTWRLQNGDNGLPAIIGEITVPDRNALIDLVITRSLSTPEISHILAITLPDPASFPTAGVAELGGIFASPTADIPGDPLRGIRIAQPPDGFWLNLPTELMETTMALLRDRDWLTIGVVYRNGLRAVVVVNKGESGRIAFATALDAWGE